jgi:hypothetical protein
VSFATVYSTVISGTCTVCHSAATMAGQLDMSTEATAFGNLTTGTSSATLETGCSEHYVNAGVATTSLLYQKVMGGASLRAACGMRMPRGGAMLSATDITLIENWINDGALP